MSTRPGTWHRERVRLKMTARYTMASRDVQADVAALRPRTDTPVEDARLRSGRAAVPRGVWASDYRECAARFVRIVSREAQDVTIRCAAQWLIQVSADLSVSLAAQDGGFL
jgi:hypothetical protein